jgi:hypothetical protein
VSGWTSQARVTLTAAAVILTLCLFGVRYDVGSSLQSDRRFRPETASRSDRGATIRHAPTGDVDDAPAEGAQDLYGNEVSDAVTTYKIDGEGSLYEVHSPRTGLPHLGPPKG